ncbi:MAG: hypothetical protein EXS49_01925 [Candidatus Pacebacteria bacterium]|nr:hypothetical protein [Candidatus Paceibacterota bacterium]
MKLLEPIIQLLVLVAFFYFIYIHILVNMMIARLPGGDKFAKWTNKQVSGLWKWVLGIPRRIFLFGWNKNKPATIVIIFVLFWVIIASLK